MARSQPPPTDAFRQFDRLSFVTRGDARAGLGGDHLSRRPSPSTDFVDFRPYQPGDDFRRVDWNIYGRLGSLQVKVTEGRERLQLLLVLDCSESMACGAPDKLEFATQLVAALAYIGMARADAVSVVCLNRDSPPASRLGPFGRRERMPELLRQLALVGPAGLVDLNANLTTCVVGGGPPTLAVVVSDLLARQGVAQGLDALRAQRADVAVVHVVSPDEINPPLNGEVELIDAESSETVELGVSLETLAAYRARFAEWLDQRATECRGRGFRYVRTVTDRPLASVILDDLRRGGVLR
ncbi:MAG TPA: DUF58 domain-containing protein [Chloroflexota bacterium]